MVTFCNCNYEAATEFCSTTTICRTTCATENYNAYYAKLQYMLCKTTAALQYNVEDITICTVANYLVVKLFY